MRVVFFALFLLLSSQPAHALLCGVSVSNLSFGNIDPLSGSPADSSAAVTVNCTGVPLTTIRVCLNIASGSGGADGSGRYLSDGAGGVIRYQLYQDAARTVVWGSTTWGLGGSAVQVDVPINVGGSGSAPLTLYGRVFGGQSSVLSGNYTSNFNGLQLSFPYQLIALFDCSSILSFSPLFAISSFMVSADVPGNCVVAAQNINFGSHGNLSGNIDAAGQISLTCTPGKNYTVALDNGQNGSSPGARKMRKVLETITYGLYRDTSRTQLWGNSPGVDTVSGTGSGAEQLYDVYARVPAQTTPGAGTYTDVIAVTVTY
jgi:spore coat protein U-like protein